MAQANLNWVLTAYALAFGGLLPVGGRAGVRSVNAGSRKIT
ncbi:hypothetical protein [Actinoallomurus sp. NPDC052274]